MRFPNDHDAIRGQRVTKFLDHDRGDRFAAAASVGMQNNETGERIEPRERIARRNGKPKGLVRIGAECFR